MNQTDREKLDLLKTATEEYVCLVPNEGSRSVVTQHEYSNELCDCEVLWLINKVEELSASRDAYAEALAHALRHGIFPTKESLTLKLNAILAGKRK